MWNCKCQHMFIELQLVYCHSFVSISTLFPNPTISIVCLMASDNAGSIECIKRHGRGAYACRCWCKPCEEPPRFCLFSTRSSRPCNQFTGAHGFQSPTGHISNQGEVTDDNLFLLSKFSFMEPNVLRYTVYCFTWSKENNIFWEAYLFFLFFLGMGGIPSSTLCIWSAGSQIFNGILYKNSCCRLQW